MSKIHNFDHFISSNSQMTYNLARILKSAHFWATQVAAAAPGDVAAVTLGLAHLGATFCALVRPSDEKSESATGAAHVLCAGMAVSARRGIAVWDRVPRAGVVRNDVASLSAPSRAAGSATAREASGCSDMP